MFPSILECLVAHGPKKIFDLRLNGVSFPQRPEFFVLLCSSLPLVFTVITRPMAKTPPPIYDKFLRGWGFAQARFFFDLFTRTAAVYHMVYWAYRTPIILLLWRIYQAGDHYVTVWKNRPKPVKKTVSSPTNKSVVVKATDQRSKSGSRGRSREHGVKKPRAKPVKGSEKDRKMSSSASHASSDQQKSPSATPLAQVVNAGGVSVITPQPLLAMQPNMMSPYAMGRGVPGQYDQIVAQNLMNYYSTMNQGQPNPMMGMGYGMNFNMGMNPNMAFNQSHLMTGNFSHSGMQSPLTERSGLNLQSPTGLSNDLEANRTHAPPRESLFKIISKNPPSRRFCILCKRIIPAFIYGISFFLTLPAIFAFVEDHEPPFLAARCNHLCRSYFYYDLVMIVTVPTIMIIVGFYHAALCRRQLNGGTKMSYRLRCYYVTFILLNIPMFVLMITSIVFRLMDEYTKIYGTGILIALTAYHSNFALKSTVYTTGCNCICCTNDFLIRFPFVGRCLNYFITPVYLKDKEVTKKGATIPVHLDK